MQSWGLWAGPYPAWGQGGPAPRDKVLAPLVGPGRYILSVQTNKFSNKNTLFHLKNSLASGGFAPGF